MLCLVRSPTAKYPEIGRVGGQALLLRAGRLTSRILMKPLCQRCNKRPVKARGNGKWRPVCGVCHGFKANKTRPSRRRHHLKWRKGKPRKSYRKIITGTCSKCGFKAVDLCQMDVDHIDGNHSNNSSTNLQEICANCHRLKTKLNKDYLKVHA